MTKLNTEEAEHVRKGICVMQIAYGTPWTEYCKKKATQGFYCREHANDLRDAGVTNAQLGIKPKKKAHR